MLGRVTVGLFFLLLVWGNLVAGLKAGLGCPDWPLCHGRVLPPFRLDVWMEFLHRVIAAAAGIALLALAYERLRAYRGAAKAVPAAAVALLLAEIAMGGAVVLLRIPVQLTTVHFIVGLLVFVLAYYMKSFDGVAAPAAFAFRGRSALYFGMGALVFLLAALGAYVRHSDAGLACPDWPTCAGGILPAVLPGKVLVQFSHRVIAALVFLTVAALYAASAVDPALGRQRRAARGLFLMILAQVAVGGAVVLTRLYFLATAVHLAVALGMLAVLITMWTREVRPQEVLP